MDSSVRPRRKQREKIQITKLRAVYFYDLNDWLGNEYKKEDTHVVMGDKFRPVLRKYDRVSRRAIHKNKNSFSPDDFLIKLEHHLSQNVSDFPKFCRVSLLAVNNKYNIKMTAILFQDNIGDDRILYNLNGISWL